MFLYLFVLIFSQVSSAAMVISDLIPAERRGTSYEGTMHITDWLPTLLHLATNGEWTHGYVNQTLDGVNMWPALIADSESPREEIVHVIGDASGGYAAILRGEMKFLKNFNEPSVGSPKYVFERDEAPGNTVTSCPFDSFEGFLGETEYAGVDMPDAVSARTTLSAMQAVVSSTVTDISDVVSTTLAVGFFLLIFTMFACKTVYDCFMGGNGKLSFVDGGAFDDHKGAGDDDLKVAYGGMNGLYQGP
jgi:hypothetical protein